MAKRRLPSRKSLTRETWIDHFALLREAPAHDFTVVLGCQQMTTRTKERCNRSEGCQEALGVPGRLEAAHSPFSLPRWLVGIFSTIVGMLVEYVPHIGQYFRLGGSVAAKLIGDDGSRNVLQSSQKLAKELLRSASVTTWLYKYIENLAVLIDSAPQILQLAVDRQIDFIEMPAISRARCAGSKAFGIGPAELLRPISNGFVGYRNPALSHDLFDVAIAQAEAKVKPHAVADDFRRESAAVIQGL